MHTRTSLPPHHFSTNNGVPISFNCSAHQPETFLNEHMSLLQKILMQLKLPTAELRLFTPNSFF